MEIVLRELQISTQPLVGFRLQLGYKRFRHSETITNVSIKAFTILILPRTDRFNKGSTDIKIGQLGSTGSGLLTRHSWLYSSLMLTSIRSDCYSTYIQQNHRYTYDFLSPRGCCAIFRTQASTLFIIIS